MHLLFFSLFISIFSISTIFQKNEKNGEKYDQKKILIFKLLCLISKYQINLFAESPRSELRSSPQPYMRNNENENEKGDGERGREGDREEGENNNDDLNVYSTAIAIARMVCKNSTHRRYDNFGVPILGPRAGPVPTDPSFVRRGILDLLILTCSRIRQESAVSTVELAGDRGSGFDGNGNSSKYEDNKRRRNSYTQDSNNKNSDNNDDNNNYNSNGNDSDYNSSNENSINFNDDNTEIGKRKRNDNNLIGSRSQIPKIRNLSENLTQVPSVSFSNLLIKLLEYISECMGYTNLSLMLLDHIRWLISEWLQTENSEINNTDNPYLPLQLFPFTLLDPTCLTYKDFSLKYGSVIFPLICTMKDTRERWNALLGKCFYFLSMYVMKC